MFVILLSLFVPSFAPSMAAKDGTGKRELLRETLFGSNRKSSEAIHGVCADQNSGARIPSCGTHLCSNISSNANIPTKHVNKGTLG